MTLASVAWYFVLIISDLWLDDDLCVIFSSSSVASLYASVAFENFSYLSCLEFVL